MPRSLPAVPPAYLYCIETVGQPYGKVGVSWNPWGRMSSFRAPSPFDLRFRHVLQIPTRREADAHEAHILAYANSHRERGEWVLVDERLDALFAAVKPATCALEQFQTPPAYGRQRAKNKDTANAVRREVLKGKAGATAVAKIGFSGHESEFDRSVVIARLADGYGVQDVLVMDGIPEDFSRAVIADLTAKGALRAVLGLRPLAAE